MAITVDSGLQRDVIMAAALEGLKKTLLPASQFSTVHQDVALEGTDKVEVPYFPNEASASVDHNGTYAFSDTYTSSVREVTIDKRKYQPLSLTSAQIARQPHLGLEKIGRAKGQKLGEDILADILSLVTNANYGAAEFTGAASGFDFAAVNETMGAAADTANWMNEGRQLILSSAYYRNVVTDLHDASLYASSDPVRKGMLDGVAGFDMTNTNCVPANGENLVGFACLPSAILVATAPIMPADEGKIVDYAILADDELGIAIEYRKWFDADADKVKEVLECNYGYALGEAAALKRIVSA